MKNGYRIFDTHTHAGLARHTGRRQTIDGLLREMDRFGIDRSMVIPFPVVEDPRAAHDEIGRAVLAYPDRLAGAACLNPYIPADEYRDEVRRCREVYGFRALKLQPQYQAANPLWPTSKVVFETALENSLALIWHTGSGIPYSLPSLMMLPARDYPSLKIVLAHCGGGGILCSEAIIAALFCPNIYLELSSLMPNHILEVLSHVPAGRIMGGSDLPENLDVEFDKILGLEIAAEAKRKLLWETAISVFGE